MSAQNSPYVFPPQQQYTDSAEPWASHRPLVGLPNRAPGYGNSPPQLSNHALGADTTWSPSSYAPTAYSSSSSGFPPSSSRGYSPRRDAHSPPQTSNRSPCTDNTWSPLSYTSTTDSPGSPSSSSFSPPSSARVNQLWRPPPSYAYSLGSPGSPSSIAPAPPSFPPFPPFDIPDTPLSSTRSPHPSREARSSTPVAATLLMPERVLDTPRAHIAHPYARIAAQKKRSEGKRRRIWSHQLEKQIFTPEELLTINAPQRRSIYIASLEAYIDGMHSEFIAVGLYPVPLEALVRHDGLNTKTAKSMIAALSLDAQHARTKVLELERANNDLYTLLTSTSSSGT